MRNYLKWVQEWPFDPQPAAHFSFYLAHVFILIAAHTLSGCVTEKVNLTENFKGRTATVKMQAKSKSTVSGTVVIKEEPGRASFLVQIKGLSKNGLHGFHIHEKGDCSAPDAASAGGHFNPLGHLHGATTGPDRHAGDLGNLSTNANGDALREYVIDGLEFSGKNSIVGKSLVIHGMPDDFKTQPSGNSGTRIACGVIELDKN